MKSPLGEGTEFQENATRCFRNSGVYYWPLIVVWSRLRFRYPANTPLGQ